MHLGAHRTVDRGSRRPPRRNDREAHQVPHRRDRHQRRAAHRRRRAGDGHATTSIGVERAPPRTSSRSTAIEAPAETTPVDPEAVTDEDAGGRDAAGSDDAGRPTTPPPSPMRRRLRSPGRAGRHEPAAVVAPLAVTTVHSTDKDAAGWDMTKETRAFGHNEYVAERPARVDRAGHGQPRPDQVEGRRLRRGELPLADARQTSIYFDSYSGVRPSVQLVVDRNGDGTPGRHPRLRALGLRRGQLVDQGDRVRRDGRRWATPRSAPSRRTHSEPRRHASWPSATPSAPACSVTPSSRTSSSAERPTPSGSHPWSRRPPVVTTVHSTDKDVAGWGMTEETRAVRPQRVRRERPARVDRAGHGQLRA